MIESTSRRQFIQLTVGTAVLLGSDFRRSAEPAQLDDEPWPINTLEEELTAIAQVQANIVAYGYSRGYLFTSTRDGWSPRHWRAWRRLLAIELEFRRAARYWPVPDRRAEDYRAFFKDGTLPHAAVEELLRPGWIAENAGRAYGWLAV